MANIFLLFKLNSFFNIMLTPHSAAILTQKKMNWQTCCFCLFFIVHNYTPTNNFASHHHTYSTSISLPNKDKKIQLLCLEEQQLDNHATFQPWPQQTLTPEWQLCTTLLLTTSRLGIRKSEHHVINFLFFFSFFFICPQECVYFQCIDFLCVSTISSSHNLLELFN